MLCCVVLCCVVLCCVVLCCVVLCCVVLYCIVIMSSLSIRSSVAFKRNTQDICDAKAPGTR